MWLRLGCDVVVETFFGVNPPVLRGRGPSNPEFGRK
ncbi:hypothetical protein A2U01_0063458, partial [Trifolium medium]|nr:hypothetical protein [Trifolium medium]